MHFQPWKVEEFSFRILFSDLITMNRARYFLWLKKSTCKLRQAWKIACVEQKNLCSEIMALPIIRKKLKTSAIKLFFCQNSPTINVTISCWWPPRTKNSTLINWVWLWERLRLQYFEVWNVIWLQLFISLKSHQVSWPLSKRGQKDRSGFYLISDAFSDWFICLDF